MVFQQGHPGYRPKGSKNKKTLEKEERRAIFDEEVSKDFLETIKKAKPEYKLDQFLGKAPDEVIVRGAIKIDVDIANKNAITQSPENNSEG